LAVSLLTILSVNAVFGGVVTSQRVHLPRSNSLLGESSTTESPASESRDLEALEPSLPKSLDEEAPESEVMREYKKALDNMPAFPDDDFFNDDLVDAEKARKEKQQETALEATSAVAYVAGTAASFLTRPLINTLPPNFNRAIISFASFVNSISRNNKTVENGINNTLHSTNGSSRQARAFPAYGFDGAVSVSESTTLSYFLNFP